MDRTQGRLDQAVLAYRENPTEENNKRLLEIQREHVDNFYAEQTGVYIERTRRNKMSEKTFRIRIFNSDDEPIYHLDVEAATREAAVESVDIDKIRSDFGWDDLTIGTVREVK